MLRLSLLLGALALLASSPEAQTCTTSWAAAQSGSWSDDANWSNGAPDASDTACITASGVYTVTLDRTQALAGLAVGGSSGTQTLAMTSGTFSTLGEGLIGPRGVVEIGTTGLRDVTGTLDVEGTLVHRNGSGFLTQGGTVDIAPGGTLRVRTGINSVNMGSGTDGDRARFIVRGTLLFDAEGQAPNFVLVVGDLDLRGGTIAVTDGRIDIQSQGRWAGGTFDVGEDGYLWFLGGAGSTGVYEVSGTLDGTPAGQVQFSSGATLAAAPEGATLDVGGAGIEISPGSGQATFLQGTFTNTGRATVTGNGLWMQGASLLNEGDLTVRTTLRMLADARLINARGATLRLVDGGGVVPEEGGGRIVNRGDLLGVLDQRTSAGSTIRVPVDVEGALVAAEAADLFFLGGGTWTDATVTVAEDLDLWVYGAEYVLEGTFSGNSEGELLFASGGTFTAASGGAVLDVGGNGVEVFPGSGQATFLQGTFTNTGRATVTGNGLWMQGASLLNEGDLTVRTTLRLNQGATVRNTATAIFAGGGSVTGDASGGTFTNEGLILKTEGGTLSFNNYLRSQPGSEIRMVDGRVFFRDENPEHYGEGVLLTGGEDGVVFMNAPQLMQGTVSPGLPGQPIVPFEFSDSFRMDDVEGDARLVIDVGPDGTSDRIESFSTTVLGGTLVVRVQDGYTPTAGEAWTIIRDLRNNVVQGTFSSVEVIGGPPEITFVADTSAPGAVVLRAASGVAVSAPLAEVSEGQPTSFVLSHPATADPFSIAYEVDGSATRFADYTLGTTREFIRAQPNTTETIVSLFPRRDTDTTEGTESVVFRVIPGGDASPVPGAAEADVAILDGPSSDALALESIVPARGQNLGTVTPTILGAGLTDGAQIRLTGPATIDGQDVALDPTGAGAQASFDLADAPAGTYDVVVESGGGSETLASAFTVEEGELGVPVWASISGTSAPRIRRWSTYTLTVGNDADVDLYDTFVLLRITDGVEYEVSGVRVPESLPEGVEEYVGIDVGEVIAVPLYFYKLPARGQRTLTVRIRPTGTPVGIGDGAGVSYELYPPNPRALFTYSGEFTDFDLDVQDRRPTNWGVIGGALADALASADARGHDPERAVAGVLKQLSDSPGNPWPRDDSDLTLTELQDLYGGLGAFNQYRGEVEVNLPNPWAEAAAWGLGTFVLGAAVLAGSIPVGTAAIIGGGVLAVASIVSAGNSAERIGCSRSRTCSNPPGDRGLGSPGGTGGPGGGPGSDVALGSPGGTGGPGGGPSGGAGGGAGGKVGGAFDPNDKYGPFGEGGMRFYDPATATTPYTIAFENIETATFPAQEVIVIDTLDTDVFDLSTFSLGPIRWSNGYVVTPPPGAKTFETEVDLAPEIAATLLITASLDEATGLAVWRFATLDPNTGDLPEDGTIGFLPPNVTQPEGEGYIAFSVRTKDNLTTGTTVANGAEIIFDVNEPIITPVWTNTVDVTAPVSQVEPLASTELNPLTITATGSDAGSGITVYSLFASQDGGPFVEVAQSPNGTFEFTGEEGSTYGFYSLAMDFVTNTEGPKTEAETTTMVAVDAEGVPTGPLTLTLEAPRPNPARGAVRLRYGVPNATDVDVRVLDALGREVAVLARGEAPAGWHEATWTPGVASGMYVVEVRAGDAVQHQRLTVVR